MIGTYPLALSQRLRGGGRRGAVLHVDLLVGRESRDKIHSPSGNSDNSPRNPVADRLRLAVGGHDGEHLLLRVAVVRPCWGRSADEPCLFGREEILQVVWGCC